MVHAVSASFPFPNGEGLVFYHPAPVEKYVSVAPGIEVSIEPCAHIPSGEQRVDSPLYDRRGRLVTVKRKGELVDSYL